MPFLRQFPQLDTDRLFALSFFVLGAINYHFSARSKARDIFRYMMMSVVVLETTKRYDVPVAGLRLFAAHARL
jgi:hypothetical protein